MLLARLQEVIVSSTIHVVCPHCDAVNRIPSGRPAAEANCGKCREGLFSLEPRDLNGERFRKHVGRNDIPVVVDFWAPWCGPCRTMAPEFERAAGELKSVARLVKLNTENETAIASRFGIRSIPTIIMFKHGREAARQSGAMRAADIVRWVKSSAGRTD